MSSSWSEFEEYVVTNPAQEDIPEERLSRPVESRRGFLYSDASRKAAQPRLAPPSILLAGLHDDNGRINAQKVADFMAVPLKRLASGLGLEYKTIHRSPSSEAVQGPLQPIKRSLELLTEFLGEPQAVRIWLNTPHPDLDGSTALETIFDGKAEAVRVLLENAWNGIPG